jgi:formylglycine-generating enzyme
MITIPGRHAPETAVPLEPMLVSIPGGSFLMGSDSAQDCERPVHCVRVDPFLLAATQLTNAEYDRFLRATRATPPPWWNDPHFSQPEQPVAGVSWHEAVSYCNWLRARTGRDFRLPTEAEWERAARGGLEQKLFPWGDEPPESRPDYEKRWKAGPEAVARYASSPFGLYDIGDNVHEWCSDWYDPDYYRIAPERNPRGPDQCPMKPARKSSRGGSWRHHIKVARCSARSSIPPEFQYADYGFRIACGIGSVAA